MNFNVKIIVVTFLVTIVSVSCITEIDVFEENVEILVIQGEITNDNKGVSVSLAYTTNYNTVVQYTKVKEATVKISNDLGDEYSLKYDDYGVFTNTDIVGEIGRSYQLLVTLENGDKYYSLPEKIIEVPSIEDLSYRRVAGDVGIFVNFKDPDNEDNYYRWRYKGTYEVHSPLSGDICWTTDFDREFLNVSSDFFYDGKNINDQNVITLQYDTKLNYGYSLLVEQQSLSKEAYNYWNAIKKQIENGGTIFETSNYQIQGNIKSESNPSETVLGYFSASSVSSKRIFINQFTNTFEEFDCDIPPPGSPPRRCYDCTVFPGGSKREKPSFWPL